jgi:hypothetical protein
VDVFVTIVSQRVPFKYLKLNSAELQLDFEANLRDVSNPNSGFPGCISVYVTQVCYLV